MTRSMITKVALTSALALPFTLAALSGCDRRKEVTTSEPARIDEPAPAVPYDPAPRRMTERSTTPPFENDGVGEKTSTTETTGADLALAPVEGELQVDVHGKAPESLTYAMKGDKVRLGLSATPGRNDKGVDAIIDTSKKKAVVLLNDRKEYVEVDLAELANKAVTRAQEVEVQKLGVTSTVAGRSCEEWILKDKIGQVHACVAKGAPLFDLAAIEQRANFTAPGWLHKVIDGGYVPLRVSITDAGGKSLASTELANTSRNVDDSKFTVPEGYKKTDVSKLRDRSR